jgi:hypothetical protein
MMACEGFDPVSRLNAKRVHEKRKITAPVKYLSEKNDISLTAYIIL